MLVALAVIIGVFAYCNIFNGNIDDLSVRFSAQPPGLFSMYAPTRRFLTAGIGALLDLTATQYYDLIGLWCILLGASLVFLCYQISRYLSLGHAGVIWISVASASHGFMAEIYSFATGYISFSAGMIGAALVLLGLKQLPHSPRLAYFVGILGSIIIIGSYQSFIVLSPAIFLVRFLLEKRDPGKIIFPPLVVLAFFGASTVVALFADLMFSSVFPPGPGRALVWSNLFFDQSSLVSTFFEIHFPPSSYSYGIIFPLHERYVYFLAFSVFVVLVVSRLLRSASLINILLVCAYIWTLFVAMMGIFNLLPPTYWPTARSLVALCFLHPVLLFLVVSWQPCPNHGLRSIYSYVPPSALWWLSVLFIGASIGNQLSTYYARSYQTQADVALASAIVTELRERSQIQNQRLEDVPVGVVGSWLNYAQQQTVFFDYGASAFALPWSQVPLLRAVSGIHLKEFRPRKDQCPTISTAFEIIRVEEGWLICLK